MQGSLVKKIKEKAVNNNKVKQVIPLKYNNSKLVVPISTDKFFYSF